METNVDPSIKMFEKKKEVLKIMILKMIIQKRQTLFSLTKMIEN